MTDAAVGARIVLDTFRAFHDRFNAVTRRATVRFVERDWHGCESDAVERLDLYTRFVDDAIASLRRNLNERSECLDTWRAVKAAYSARIEEGANAELAQTFFSSVTRRIFSTQGVEESIEYTALDPVALSGDAASWSFVRFDGAAGVRHAVEDILRTFAFDADYRDIDADVRAVTERVIGHLERRFGTSNGDAFEILRSVFYRMKHAYLVGRLHVAGETIPFVLPLLHEAGGIYVDAVLIDQVQASILFSFTRAHFNAEAGVPLQLVLFLHSILPQKPIAELYISLGFVKHGKTELYRNLEQQLRVPTARFETATGDPGMVMLVFTLRDYDMVFKVIRDRFAFPKATTARDVVERYRIVCVHDRVGRLVEAQEFQHLKFSMDRIEPSLLEELLSEASNVVRLQGDHVIIDHLYTERRVRPLNLYLREVEAEEAGRAAIDYGDAIRELAEANIFPGDFLLKNFGVTRHGRVVFYDYDELCLLTDCNFRELPTARTPEDEMSAEPWFSVAENDVFPEEFRNFLGLDELQALFERHHAEIFTTGFWRDLQYRHRAGEVFDVFPYPRTERLHGSPRNSGPRS